MIAPSDGVVFKCTFYNHARKLTDLEDEQLRVKSQHFSKHLNSCTIVENTKVEKISVQPLVPHVPDEG